MSFGHIFPFISAQNSKLKKNAIQDSSGHTQTVIKDLFLSGGSSQKSIS
jgi:hypothetical protein